MAVTETRVAVKGGHGTSKTWSLADLAIWFLHCWSPAIVVTTAPSGEIVKNEIWRYMRRSRLDAKIPLLSGILPKEPLWDIGADRYAIGLATDRGDRFRVHKSTAALLRELGGEILEVAPIPQCQHTRHNATKDLEYGEFVGNPPL